MLNHSIKPNSTVDSHTHAHDRQFQMLHTKNLCKSFNDKGHEHAVLNNINLTIYDDEIVANETESEAGQSDVDTVIGCDDVTCEIDENSDMDCAADGAADDAADDAADGGLDEDLEASYFVTDNGAEWVGDGDGNCDGVFVDGYFVEEGEIVENDGFDDDELIIEHYERSFEECEELGLNDMKV